LRFKCDTPSCPDRDQLADCAQAVVIISQSTLVNKPPGPRAGIRARRIGERRDVVDCTGQAGSPEVVAVLLTAALVPIAAADPTALDLVLGRWVCTRTGFAGFPALLGPLAGRSAVEPGGGGQAGVASAIRLGRRPPPTG